MDHLIKNFRNFVIIKKGSPPPGFFIDYEENFKFEDSSLIKKGFFNGDILGCVVCNQIDNDITAECYRFKFFDILFNRIKAEFFPQMVNVNAIIEIKDQNNEEYILLIKRPFDVYAYPDYWDFPAGLVPFDVSLESRLLDRIEKDTGMKREHLLITPQPSFIVTREKFFGLYYRIISLISKKQLEELLKLQSEKREIIFLKKSQILGFLENNEKVYPKFLNEFF